MASTAGARWLAAERVEPEQDEQHVEQATPMRTRATAPLAEFLSMASIAALLSLTYGRKKA